MLLLCDSRHRLTDSTVDGEVVDEPGRAQACRNQPDQARALTGRCHGQIVRATDRCVVDAKPRRLQRRMRVALDGLYRIAAPYGVTHLDMPATPQAVWRAIQTGRTGSGRGSPSA